MKLHFEELLASRQKKLIEENPMLIEEKLNTERLFNERLNIKILKKEKLNVLKRLSIEEEKLIEEILNKEKKHRLQKQIEATIKAATNHARLAIKTHFVYFIRCVNFIKIGYTHDMTERFSTLQPANPYSLEILMVLSCHKKTHAKELETKLHNEFIRLNHRNEWFRYDEKILAIANKIVDGKKYFLYKKHDVCIKKIVVCEAGKITTLGIIRKSTKQLKLFNQ